MWHISTPTSCILWVTDATLLLPEYLHTARSGNIYSTFACQSRKRHRPTMLERPVLHCSAAATFVRWELSVLGKPRFDPLDSFL